ncbi:LuxR family transcriptional regulator [Emcibacter sp.]|uniref:helix-turn-helix transcriptional regulator n=1 Tax=Emcibacter sp. TaxID=1979954 RepID=UPI002AA81F81|nr:LuxR family transcriptional regulator [Emcibacter sp.]
MQEFEVVQDFVSASARVLSEDELVEAFDKAIQKLGFTHFSCASMMDYNNPVPGSIFITKLPESWTSRYLDKNYHQQDAVLDAVQNRNVPVIWENMHVRNRFQKKILKEASECGLKNGISVQLFVPGFIPTTFSVSSEEQDFDRDSYLLLHLLCVYFHEAVLRVREESGSPQFEKKELTGREKECLYWAASGKSDTDIADILSISKHTVHFHIENAKRKFNLSTRIQTVVRAILSCSITP